MSTSGRLDKTALGLRDANALPTFAPIPYAHPLVFKTFFGIFLEALCPFLPRDLKKSPKPSAAIVLTLTVIGFFQIHNEESPFSILLPLEVIS